MNSTKTQIGREYSVKQWIATARHPQTKRLYTKMVYQPMLELLAYMRANGFTDESCYHYIRRDAMTFLDELDDAEQFDLAVVDPPTFSNSKSTENDWDVQKDHVMLLDKLAEHMPTGGVVYFSNNYRRFKLDEYALKEKYDIRDISNKTVPEDFRNKRIHQCWRMVVK